MMHVDSARAEAQRIYEPPGKSSICLVRRLLRSTCSPHSAARHFWRRIPTVPWMSLCPHCYLEAVG